jgi:uncharacterized protein with PIN domain
MKKVLCPECGKFIVPLTAEGGMEVVIRGERFNVKSFMPKCPEYFLMKGV